MPCNNKYTAYVAQQVQFMSLNQVNREKEINDFATNYEWNRPSCAIRKCTAAAASLQRLWEIWASSQR